MGQAWVKLLVQLLVQWGGDGRASVLAWRLSKGQNRVTGWAAAGPRHAGGRR